MGGDGEGSFKGVKLDLEEGLVRREGRAPDENGRGGRVQGAAG